MSDENPIFRSLAMIEEKIRERLTVEMLAAGINFSKYHYQRIFREAVGDTVMGYVTRRRLYLAAGELAGTGDSVLEIALRYSYDSHEGFTRSFKAHTGVTPTEYRKYHASICFPGRRKERCTMTASKHRDELIRELNSLIVQAKETAAETKKYQGADAQAAAFYGQFWELAAGRAEKMAEELEEILRRAAMAGRDADEISACFLLVKAVDGVAFEADVTAFQVGLTIARAMPEHQALFHPLCARYDSLARNARMRSGKMVEFLTELSDLILRDMRKQAEERIRSAVESGRTAAEVLSDPALPYGYIADGVAAIAEKLGAMALEDVTLSALTDAAFDLETVRFAADMDVLRAPQHRQLFEGISDFQERLDEAVEFFRELTGERLRAFEGAGGRPEGTSPEERACRDLAMQEGAALFWLKGEVQKLGDARLDAGQKAAFNAICGKIDEAVQASRRLADNREKDRIAELLREAYGGLVREAERLGPYGGAVRYLAEKVKAPLQYFTAE